MIIVTMVTVRLMRFVCTKNVETQNKHCVYVFDDANVVSGNEVLTFDLQAEAIFYKVPRVSQEEEIRTKSQLLTLLTRH